MKTGGEEGAAGVDLGEEEVRRQTVGVEDSPAAIEDAGELRSSLPPSLGERLGEGLTSKATGARRDEALGSEQPSPSLFGKRERRRVHMEGDVPPADELPYPLGKRKSRVRTHAGGGQHLRSVRTNQTLTSYALSAPRPLPGRSMRPQRKPSSPAKHCSPWSRTRSKRSHLPRPAACCSLWHWSLIWTCQRLCWENVLLAHRPLRWSLHQLACTIVPLLPEDPAALAFAGLRPEDPPPTDDEPPSGADEQEFLRTLVDDLVGLVRERLGEEDPRSDDELLAWLCLRPAQILADPGWFEIRMALDSVDVAIRLAGLDLDPGFLPFLGIVLKFIYE